MQLQTVPLDELQVDPANVRRHGDRDLEAIKASLSRFGQQHPIIVDGRGVVRAGNGRLEAMRRLGWEECQVVYTDLEGAELAAFAIADNRTAELSGWDVDALSATLSALKEEDPELFEATGFDDEAMSQALQGIDPGVGDGLGGEGDGEPERQIEEDEAPEPPKRAVSKPGDLWLLGEHRVLCGDSTKEEDVERLMDSRQADLIWTDPPYGVSHIGGTKDPRRKTYRTGGVVHNDDKTGGELVGLVSSSVANIPRHDATVLYMASPPGSHLREMIDAFNASGFKFRHSLVWVKSAFVFGRADYHYQHEMILYGWGERHEWSGPRNLATVMEFQRGDKTIEHPTSKPVGLVTGTAENHPAMIMVDPFLGSGTTLIAAEQLGRKCYGLELDPRYVDVIVKRWEALTGGEAKLEGSGMTFAEAQIARWEQ